jgi:hypothetical protein
MSDRDVPEVDPCAEIIGLQRIIVRLLQKIGSPVRFTPKELMEDPPFEIVQTPSPLGGFALSIAHTNTGGEL